MQSRQRGNSRAPFSYGITRQGQDRQDRQNGRRTDSEQTLQTRQTRRYGVHELRKYKHINTCKEPQRDIRCAGDVDGRSRGLRKMLDWTLLLIQAKSLALAFSLRTSLQPGLAVSGYPNRANTAPIILRTRSMTEFSTRGGWEFCTASTSSCTRAHNLLYAIPALILVVTDKVDA